MSLHGKVIAWLLLFGTLIVFAFGVGDYIQSTIALRYALESRAGALVLQMAEEIEHRHQLATSEMALVAYAVTTGQPLPALHGRYRSVRVLRGDRVAWSARDLGPARAASGCAHGEVSFSVPVTTSRGEPLRVEAVMGTAEFFAGLGSVGTRLGRRGFTAVVRADDGAPVYDRSCVLDTATERSLLKEALLVKPTEQWGGAPVRSVNAGRRSGAMLVGADAATTGWLVATALDYDEFAAPFVSARRQYIAIVSFVLVLIMSALLLGFRSNMRRLTAIAEAADEIGRGRFDVWLPPPTGDEIGSVSLALGRMMSRLATTMRRMEVRRSMAAVGEMATYLSHEIRNPLSAVRLNLQMLSRDMERGSVPEDAEELINLSLSELNRLENVVKTVLEVGRTDRSAAGTCDAHAVVRETMQVMQAKFRGARVFIEPRLAAEDAQVAISSAALRGVVVNLLLNALDALDDRMGGIVRVNTGIDADPDRRWFELRVSDNGPGVPEHLRARIFDPFFTTKPTGHGIGLATAIRVVEECGGFIRYETAAWSGGAEFVIDLPLAADTVAATPAPDAVAAGRA
jgi:signal transduction histidine kinase